jgi:hypothetical protein
MRLAAPILGAILLVIALPAAAPAQPFEVIGTRAQGMGGAFVGVADDASAVYWNPAGLAAGAYFSLMLDGTRAEAAPDSGSAGARSGWIVALSMPALGISYYRLEATMVTSPEAPRPGELRLDSLVTHHAGATLVQSLADGLAVGATVKMVRGVAGSAFAPGADAEDVLDAWDVIGRRSTRADVDLGIMATGALGSIGLTVRNVTAPSFETGAGSELRLDRQVRGGASILLLDTWKLAADVDLTTNSGPLGDVRDLAVGTEGRLTRRVFARGGIRLNTAGERGRTPALSAGASYAVTGAVMLDVQVTGGSDEALRGWGVAGRVVF